MGYQYMPHKLTILVSLNSNGTYKRPCINAVDSSYSERVVGVWRESTRSEGSGHRIYCTSDHHPTYFLAYHCVVSDLPITFNALYSTPGHTDTSGGCGGSHITRGCSGGCETMFRTIKCIY